MGSVLSSSDTVFGAVHVRWDKYLRMQYSGKVPKFLETLEEEAQKAAPVAASGDGGNLASFAGLSPDDRLAAVRMAVRDFAREVVDNADLEGDAALLDSGMDSLSGVEFRNRLATEFEGVRMPNSVVFDHPTIDALANFINEQLGDTIAGDAPAGKAPAKV